MWEIISKTNCCSQLPYGWQNTVIVLDSRTTNMKPYGWLNVDLIFDSMTTKFEHSYKNLQILKANMNNSKLYKWWHIVWASTTTINDGLKDDEDATAIENEELKEVELTKVLEE